jgi:flagellar motility protein MotE (MotC chaperone)
MVLQKMDDNQAAKILALMDPQRAAALSQAVLQYRPQSSANAN